MKNNLLQEGYDKAIELLLNNSTRYGILASAKSERAVERNYLSIFSRDASICCFGMLLSKNKKLINTSKKSLLSLASLQAVNGQIPNYVKPEIKYADFWYVGCIDATLWWLLAIKFFDIHSGEKAKLAIKLKKEIGKAINWLLCQEHQKFFLLSQNEASDWADIMPRSGFVLYTNALWYQVKKLYKLSYEEATKESFNYLFYPQQKVPESYFKKNHRAKRLIEFTQEHGKHQISYLSWVGYQRFGQDTDVYGNILALFFNLADKNRKSKILKFLIEQEIDIPRTARVVLNPIKENSKDWREYMKMHNQNYPFQYHNGGAWPYVGGFWAILLEQSGKKKIAKESLIKLAETNKINNWQFNEWFHGKTGKPMGMAGQSWNAAMYVFAFQHLKSKKII